MQQDILQKIENATSPDFGNILSNSFELFKKTWVDSFLHLLITLLVIIPVMFLIYIPFIPALLLGAEGGDITQYNPTFGYSIIGILGFSTMYFIVIVFVQTISFAITAHFFKVLKIKDLDSNEEDRGYFAYLKGNGFKKVVVLSIAMFGISVAAMLLCIVPLFYVMVPLQLLIVVFAFNPKLSVSDLLTVSFKLGNKFWLLVFALILIASLIAQLGVILCIVGVFFTAYFSYIPLYYFYKETIGFEEDINPDNVQFTTDYIN